MKNIDKEQVVALRRELTLMAQDSLSYTDTELAAFLTVQSSVPEAAKAVISIKKWNEENPVSIADVAPFLRAPPRQSFPSGFIVCLEDMKGGVARDSEGRPILLCYGMPHGTSDDMKKITAYALQRASAYCKSELGHAPGESCIVVEVMSRERKKLLAPSFRFPDNKLRNLLDFMRSNSPGSQFSKVHFCGVPSFVTSMFSLCNPFISSDLFSRINVNAGFKHLKKEGHIPRESLLPYWDKEGTFNFDLDKYIGWRCQEEGIDVSHVCRAGKGRKSREAQTSYPSTKGVLDRESGPRRKRIKNRASGNQKGAAKGLLAAARWKANFLPGALFYLGSKGMPTPHHAGSSFATFSTTGHVGSDMARDLLEPVESSSIFGFSSDETINEQNKVLTSLCSHTTSPFPQEELLFDKRLNLC